MPPRLNLFNARTAVPVFRQTSINVSRPSIATTINSNRSTRHGLKTGLSSSTSMQKRYNSSASGGDNSERPKAPTEDPLPHVSEEAAEISKIMDKKCDGTPASPELEQGTPISEVSAWCDFSMPLLFRLTGNWTILLTFFPCRSSNGTKKPRNICPRSCKTRSNHRLVLARSRHPLAGARQNYMAKERASMSKRPQ